MADVGGSESDARIMNLLASHLEQLDRADVRGGTAAAHIGSRAAIGAVTVVAATVFAVVATAVTAVAAAAVNVTAAAVTVESSSSCLFRKVESSSPRAATAADAAIDGRTVHANRIVTQLKNGGHRR